MTLVFRWCAQFCSTNSWTVPKTVECWVGYGECENEAAISL